jgi:hypothetical protein
VQNCACHDILRRYNSTKKAAALQTKASYSSPVRNSARPLPKLQSAWEDKLHDLPLAGDDVDVIEDMIEIVHGYMAQGSKVFVVRVQTGGELAPGLTSLLLEATGGPAPYPEVAGLQRDGCIRG